MSTKKTIQINPELFSTNKTRKKKEKPIKTKPLIKANSLKKALLKRIKSHAKNREKEYEQSKNNQQKEEEFSNDFHSHLDYLNTVQKKNKTLKNTHINTNNLNVNANVYLPPELNDVSNEIKVNVPQTPPYGCLKNGSKPTWREWKRTTQKVNPIHFENKIASNESEKINPIDFHSINQLNDGFNDKLNKFSEREFKLQSIRNKLKDEEIKEKKKKTKIKNTVSSLKKKTMKVVNHYGKQKNKVSVLVKNSTTRKNIQKEHNILKQDSIEDVRKYLKNHYLLKVGSNAPNDVLRKIYETAHLCGEIKNTNKDNLLHNYLNDDNELNEEI